MGSEELSWPYSSCASQDFALVVLSGFFGLVFAMGSFPAVQSVSQLPLISRMLL